MDFGPARAFDDQDLINAIAAEDAERDPGKTRQKTWRKRAKYMIFG